MQGSWPSFAVKWETDFFFDGTKVPPRLLAVLQTRNYNSILVQSGGQLFSDQF